MEEMFTDIANELVEILPSNWVRCFFYSEMTEKNYRSAFYMFFDDSEEPVHCNELVNFGVSAQQLQKTFENIFQILKPYWRISVQSPKTKWTNCTFTLTSDGDFSLDVDNTDLTSETSIKRHRQNWKKKYLTAQ